MINHPIKAQPSDRITLEVRISTLAFCKDTNIQTSSRLSHKAPCVHLSVTFFLFDWKELTPGDLHSYIPKVARLVNLVPQMTTWRRTTSQSY
jgi:hypothetical protein